MNKDGGVRRPKSVELLVLAKVMKQKVIINQ